MRTGVCPRAKLPVVMYMLPLLAGFPPAASAETLAGPALPPGGKITVLERADLRKYVNGSFVGLEYRESRGILEWKEEEDGSRVEGSYYVLEELNHSGVKEARKIDEVVPVSFTILADGTYAMDGNDAYPSLRGFPVIPNREIAIGEKWRAYGMRVVRPPDDGAPTRVKFYCEFVYEGEKELDGARFRVIGAKYAVRYKRGDDPVGDDRLRSLSGSHTVSIRLSSGEGALSLMRDQVEETYVMADGTSVSYKGFMLTWFDSAVPLDRAGLAQTITQALAESGASDVEVKQKPEGVSVSLNSIRFIAEQAVVLPEESPRLDALAAALMKIPGRSFRVIGHTARAGTEKSQYDLSVARAKAVVDFLVSRGLAAERFIYEGRGGTEPVAPNDSEANMAKNRRVEIVILEN
jgi:OOP family OmpA-OmpF porin